MSSKKCSKCKETKSVSNFAFRSKKAGKLSTYCKDCHKNYSKQHYRQNKDYYIKKSKKQNQKQKAKNQKIVLEAKLNGCSLCSEKDPCCLDFHHLEEKFKEVSKMLGYSSKALLNEMSKCIVVCSNCHRKIHAGKISI